MGQYHTVSNRPTADVHCIHNIGSFLLWSLCQKLSNGHLPNLELAPERKDLHEELEVH